MRGDGHVGGSGDERDTYDRSLLFGIPPTRGRARGAADDTPPGAEPATGPAEPAPPPPEPEPLTDDPEPAGDGRSADPAWGEPVSAVQRREARLADTAALASTVDLDDALAELRNLTRELEQRIDRLAKAFGAFEGATSAMEARVAELHGVREELVQSHESWTGEAQSYRERITALERQLDSTVNLIVGFEATAVKLSGRTGAQAKTSVAELQQLLTAHRADLRRTRLWAVPALAAALIAALLLAGFLAVSPHRGVTLIGHAAAGVVKPAVRDGGRYQPPHCPVGLGHREGPVYLHDPVGGPVSGSAGATRGCSDIPGAPRRP